MKNIYEMIFIKYLILGILPNLVIPFSGLLIAERWDCEEAPPFTADMRMHVFLASAAAAACGAVILSADNVSGAGRFCNIYDGILLGIMSGSMIFACITDILTNKVYDFIWWTAAVAELTIYVRHPISLRRLVGVAVFFLIQELLFAKLYGRADCHAFCICAAVESVFSIGIIGFFLHMILSFALLTVVQYFRKNIGNNGRLKVPVPFMPYITLAFWMNMLIWKGAGSICY